MEVDKGPEYSGPNEENNASTKDTALADIPALWVWGKYETPSFATEPITSAKKMDSPSECALDASKKSELTTQLMGCNISLEIIPEMTGP